MKTPLIMLGGLAIVSGCGTTEVSVKDPVTIRANGPLPVEVVNPIPTTVVVKEPEAKVMTLENAYDKAKVRHVAFKQVALDELADQVAVADVRRSKTNDGYDRVQVFVKNLTEGRAKIRYRFNWTDFDGVEVKDPDHDAWERLAIDPGDDATLTSIAPTKNCYDFKLRLRRIKEKGNE